MRKAASKHVLIALSLILIMSLVMISCASAPSVSNQLSTLTDIRGTVTVQLTGSTAWSEAKIGMNLKAGDLIKTGANSLALITFFEGSTIELQSNTEVNIEELSVAAETDSTTISLGQTIGTTKNRVEKLVDPASHYEIATPVGLGVVRGTEFTAEVFHNGTSILTTFDGTLWAIAQGVEVAIGARQYCVIYPGKPPSQAMSLPSEESLPPQISASSRATASSARPSPSADFRASPVQGATPLTVQFSDRSGGNVISYLWDFGDGEQSTQRNPTHTYLAPGTYTITLSVVGRGGADAETKRDYITVFIPALVPDFSADKTETAVGENIQFTDLSTGDPTSWEWDFNDDGIVDSTAQNPSHSYANHGLYTVSLTISNPIGLDTELKTDYIRVPVVVEITTPEDDATVYVRTITVEGTISDTSITEATLSINGESFIISVTGGNFSQEVNVRDGDNTITVNATNAQGYNGSDTVTIHAELPAYAIMIELTWDTDYGDLDGHFIRPGGEMGNVTDDCYWYWWWLNGEPNGPDWDSSGDLSEGDPILDVDDTNGYGPEYTTLQTPPYEGIYQYKVHFFPDELLEGSSTTLASPNATVRIWINDVLVFTESETLYEDEIWDCAYIEWPSGNVTTPLP